jgi:Leucine-rich repeat (LRR) protein
MLLYTDGELKTFEEFGSLDVALQRPEDAIGPRLHRIESADSALRFLELRNLQSLSISLSDVSKLLPQLSELTELQDLYLQACKVTNFPKSILSLRHLALGNNLLQSLPVEIAELK